MIELFQKLLDVLKPPRLTGNVGIEREISQNMGLTCVIDAKYDNVDYGGPLTVTLDTTNDASVSGWGPTVLCEAKIFYGNKGVITETPFFPFRRGVSIPVQASQVRVIVRVTDSINPATTYRIKGFVCEGASPKIYSPIQTHTTLILAAGATTAALDIPDFAKCISLIAYSNTVGGIGPGDVAPAGDYILYINRPNGNGTMQIMNYYIASGEKPLHLPLMDSVSYIIENTSDIGLVLEVFFDLEF